MTDTFDDHFDMKKARRRFVQNGIERQAGIGRSHCPSKCRVPISKSVSYKSPHSSFTRRYKDGRKPRHSTNERIAHDSSREFTKCVLKNISSEEDALDVGVTNFNRRLSYMLGINRRSCSRAPQGMRHKFYVTLS